MSIRHPQILADQITKIFGEKIIQQHIFADELTLEVSEHELYGVLQTLKDHEDLQFSQLTDLCGVDYAAFGIAEWDIEASNSGFSRGVEVGAVGRSAEALKEVAEKATAPQRFAVVYHLLSMTFNARIRVRVRIENSQMPILPSVCEIWHSANWYEREAFDLFGILFKSHPDLRRILTDYGFIGHPLRKDFPLTGHVEVLYDEVQQRVVYTPVSIESRVGVPRVIRKDN